MLYALRYPFSFGVLIATFVVGVTVRGLVQQARLGGAAPEVGPSEHEAAALDLA